MAAANSTEPQQVETLAVGDFKALLQKVLRPRTDRASEPIEAVMLVTPVFDGKVSVGDVINSINAIIERLDQQLTDQVNEILHHTDFQQLEGTWRGLKHLVSRTESSEMLKVRVFNISKTDLGRSFERYPGPFWDRNPMFLKIYEEEYGACGGEPYGCLVGDYYFDHSTKDVELLREMAKLAATVHAPFIAGVAPSLLGFDSWQELAKPRDLSEIFTTADYAQWRSLRESDDARYVGLTMPRFLSRLPYSAKALPVEVSALNAESSTFAFEEDTSGVDASMYTWSNAVYAMAANINQAFAMYGWCAGIRGLVSGGAVEGLPGQPFPSDDGGVDVKCPTEISLTDRSEAALARNGMIPLLRIQSLDRTLFLSAQSLHEPPELEEAEAAANAALGAHLPYIFACSRFVHYLKCILRDKIGCFLRADMERHLSDWILDYVDTDPEGSSDEIKARKPLAAAAIEVHAVEGKYGWQGVFHLQPHYQLHGLTRPLRLVTRLPAGR